MNKSSFMLFAMAGAMTLASCSNEELNGSDTKNAQLQVVANIALPQTRAFDDQWNAGTKLVYTPLRLVQPTLMPPTTLPTATL